MKRQRIDEEASDRRMKEEEEEEEEEDEEERLAKEKLKQLQELAEKSMTERSNSTQPSSSSLSSRGCLRSSWQQIGNLLLYTAAGVRGSDKVGTRSAEQLYLFQRLRSEDYTVLWWAT